MSHALWAPRHGARARLLLPGLYVITVAMAGCASVTQDVDAYYRQMAYNYKEAREKAKMDELSLASQSKALAATGQFGRHKKVQRELDRVKAWEAKCEKQAGRFEKAAEWTEARFHLERPPIPDGPPGTRTEKDEAVLQASGATSP